MSNQYSIGIFDSGIGGLTVAHAVRELLPHEDIIYFGDTARVPYGDKSAETICAYSREITDFLLNQRCKIILIACNSASAAAYDTLRQAAHHVPIFSVIEPVVEYLQKNLADKKIGLIGTKQTVDSKVFAKKIHDLDLSIQFSALATPLLVPVIEEGFHHKNLIHEVLADYLSRSPLKDIDALILGCTHYPLIKNEINQFFQNKITLIDSSVVTAEKLKQFLIQKKLSNPQEGAGKITCYLSDITPTSTQLAEQFFSEEIVCEKLVL